jgi:hypothetical protein
MQQTPRKDLRPSRFMVLFVSLAFHFTGEETEAQRSEVLAKPSNLMQGRSPPLWINVDK